MITLERARYLCGIDDNDEPTATRDTITAITEAQDALSNEPDAATRRASPTNVLLDYLMGHMRERDPATAKLLHDWSWATLESSIMYLPDLRMPLHMTPDWGLEGRERRERRKNGLRLYSQQRLPRYVLVGVSDEGHF